MPNGVDNVEEELPAHPKMAPKYQLAVQWIIGEVVSAENAVAFQPPPRFALVACMCRPSASRLCIIAGVQHLGHSMYFSKKKNLSIHVLY
jgi:hypothetical protein